MEMNRFMLFPNYQYYDSTDGTITTDYERPLRGYKIYGNSIQDGTPSPDNPVEIQSVGDYDEATGKYKIPVEVSNENSEVETYNILLDEPLRKIGDYADYIDFRNGKLVRNIREFVLDGSNINYLVNWQYAEGYYATGYQEVAFPGLAKAPSYQSVGAILCDKAVASTYGEVYNKTTPTRSCISSSSSAIYSFFIRIKVDNVTTKDEWNNYLKENPITVAAALAEPIETDIELPQPLLDKGENIITVKTVIQPSQVDWQYYK